MPLSWDFLHFSSTLFSQFLFISIILKSVWYGKKITVVEAELENIFFTNRLVDKVNIEDTPLSFGVAPGTDVWFACNTGTNGPPVKLQNKRHWNKIVPV